MDYDENFDKLSYNCKTTQQAWEKLMFFQYKNMLLHL